MVFQQTLSLKTMTQTHINGNIYIKTFLNTAITPPYHFVVKYKECNVYHNLGNQIIKFMGEIHYGHQPI